MYKVKRLIRSVVIKNKCRPMFDFTKTFIC